MIGFLVASIMFGVLQACAASGQRRTAQKARLRGEDWSEDRITGAVAAHRGWAMVSFLAVLVGAAAWGLTELIARLIWS